MSDTPLEQRFVAHEAEAAQIHAELRADLDTVQTETRDAIAELRSAVRQALPYTSLAAALGGALAQALIYLFGG